jgi:hypothetical protein
MGKRKLIGLVLFLLSFVFALTICGSHAAAQHQGERGPAVSGQTAAPAQPAFPLYGQPPKPVPRKPCQLIEDWIKVGGTRANFSGVGIGSFPKPFPLCFPLLAKISHTAHERYVDRCGQTHWEVNLAYEMEHEGELWLTQDLSQAYANIHQFSGQQRSFRLRRGDGFYFAGHDHAACKHYDRHAFAGARQHPTLGVRLTLYAPPDNAGQRLYYMPPLFEEPERILTYACATWFSITPANEPKVSFSLPVEELRGLRKGQVVTRELTWGGDEPETGHHWTNRMTFELRGTGGPGILDVTPADGLIARGPDKDGAFNPANKTYTLKNVGQSPIDFAVSKSRDWVSAAPAGGSLTPGAETRVAVSINERARKLKTSEKDTVRFDNRTNGEGSTTRPVEVATRERWRVTFIGWDTICTDNVPLNAGIRAYWTIAVDIEIEGGQYKSGRATASFGNAHGLLASYSFIPGAYACNVLTKSIDYPAFSVAGNVSGSIVRLRLPGENRLRLRYRCQLDEKRTLDWLRTNKYGGQSPEDRVSGVDKDLRRAGTEVLPSGTYAVRLVDGLREPVGSPSALNASPLEITVKRLK